MPNDHSLRVIGPVALQAELEHLLPLFARQNKIEVDVEYDLNPAVAKRAMGGEEFDIGMSNPWFFDEMISSGRVDPPVDVPFGGVTLAIGAAGLEPEKIESSHEGVRNLLSNAESIAYTSEGTSGETFLRALKKLGLQDLPRDRLRPMGSYDPPIAAARGQVQYAVNPLTRIIAVPGVSAIATFPADLGLSIEMSMFVSKNGRHEAALQLISYLSDSELDGYLLSRGVHRYELQR